MTKHPALYIMGLFAFLFGTTAMAQGLPSEKILPLSLANEAALAALADCEAKGYRVSVAVTDKSGLIKVHIKGDGAGPHTLDSSSHKAYTSASMRKSTAVLVDMLAKNPASEGIKYMNDKILVLGGGLPITVGEEAIGGIGVGGAPGGHLDEACSQAGIDKIKDRLK
ncbi:MAG: hypothetical protein A3G18_01090 [Rhodospirillales bacterium RIFCSPLOWO2_12_FULL_58_28]|nr:MAG: hypothetical protein A3H92_04290 [Rhodospirillales bacterium RIFCSPLOWO2_02_FULL_58_16]OHC77999.1 MAG: hypothetical protein A3G18_01090 [Rhodospirillales bacterium RIFCSPLOWO2_12_FULL_58_28]